MIVITTDTETTGLIDFKKDLKDPSQPHIVQLAAILGHDDTGEIIEQYDCIIKPEGWHIPEEATAIHGITHEHAMEFGIPITEALAKLDEMAAKAEMHIAHNISFDMSMINREAFSLGLETIIRGVPRFCTMKESTNLCCLPKAKGFGFKWPKLEELYLFLFAVRPEKSHNAADDASNTFKCLVEMVKREFVKLTLTPEDKAALASEMPTV